MMKKLLLAILAVALVLSLASLAQAESGAMPQPLYVGVAAQNTTIRADMSRESEGLGQFSKGERVYVLAYEPGWLLVIDGNEDSFQTGYVLRHTVHDVKALTDDVPPYGATPAVYSAVVSRDTGAYEQPDRASEVVKAVAQGTKVAILEIEDGWARVIHWRQPVYIYLDALESLTPVYDSESAQRGDTIAAFISFFNLSDRGLNPNRIKNIEKACEYISIQLSPGEAFSFNGIAGPYRKTRGYLEAPSFVAGETVPSYGGGTCQVSSTLYNVLLPLKGDITILYRVAHGAGGASYLPHGVDAACGNERIDLRFRNDYDFPVRIEASAHHGVLYVALVKE